MENVFLLLMLASLACLFIGLKKPELFRKLLKERATKKGVALVFGISAFVFFAMFGTASDVSKSPKEINTNESVKVAQAPAPERPKTKEEMLWEAFEKGVKKSHDGYSMIYDDKKGEITVTKAPTTYWDEVDVLEDAYSDFVRFGLKAFKVEGIEKIIIKSKIDVKDKYGKASIEDGIELAMTKKEFEKFDWESMKGQNLYADAYAEDFSTQYVNIIIARVVMQKGGKAILSY